jgi:predicted ATPase/DNA-binding SARP family transcriptional activator
MRQPEVVQPNAAETTPEAIVIELLGGCRISAAGRLCEPSTWRLRKAAQIVKLLAVTSGRQLHREELLERLWPALDADAAGNNLRVTLHFARAFLTQGGFDGPTVLRLRDGRLILFPELPVQTDIDAFTSAADTALQGHDAAACDAALALYRGDLLPDDRFEDWTDEPRERLRGTVVRLLLHLVQLRLAEGAHEHAIAALRHALTHDPVNEGAHVALMRLYASGGQRVAALRQYQILREALARELDIEPDPATTRLYEALLAGERPAQPAEAAGVLPGVVATAQRAAPVVALPASLTSFVGRTQELAALGDALAQTRLVTVTGPAGIGKTRLAIEAARTAAARYPTVVMVDLSGISEPSLVPPAIGAALGVVETPGRLLDELLAERLQPGALLLVDTCEHVIDAAARVLAMLLARCPRLSVLATSRERLRIDGERAWPVPPLPIPDGPVPARDLPRVDAVQLFVERARLVAPSFAVTPDNSAAVAELCRRLEGVPLAIELAATRVRGLAPSEILDRLGNALDLLAGHARDRAPRQQSLRAAIEWSYALLSPAEQHLFQRLAIFAGSTTIEAIEAVCTPEHGPEATLDLLFSLLDKSLLSAEEWQGVTRYRQLDTIRQYAAEHLARSGDARHVLARRRDWYVALAEQAELGMIGLHTQEWMARLQPEIDTLRLVLRDSATAGDQTTVVRLAAHLWAFWLISGRLSEGRGWIEQALRDAPPGTLPEPLVVRGQAAAGLLAQRQGEYQQATRWSEESLVRARTIDDRLSLTYALTNLCLCALYRGEAERTIALAHEGLALSREIGMLAGIPTCLSSIGLAEYWRGDLEAAMHWLREAVAAAHEIGFTAFASWLLGQLADVARARGDAASARSCAEESIALGASVDDEYGPALGRRALGHLAADAGNLAEARALIADSLTAFQRMGYRTRVLECLEDLGELALRQADLPAGVTLLAATCRLRQKEGTPALPARQAILDSCLDSARRMLGVERCYLLQQRGRALSLDETVASAHAWVAHAPTGTTPGSN